MAYGLQAAWMPMIPLEAFDSNGVIVKQSFEYAGGLLQAFFRRAGYDDERFAPEAELIHEPLMHPFAHVFIAVARPVLLERYVYIGQEV